MSSKFERESSPREVDYFIALDMDGTMLRSHELTPLLTEYFIDDEVQRARAEAVIARQKGKDFDSFTYLTGESGLDLDELDTDELKSLLIKEQGFEKLRELLLMPGAATISQTLREQNIPHGILTKGGVVFQKFKLSLLRELIGEPDLQAMITSEKAKLRYIEAEWWDGVAERFIIPHELSNTQALHSKNIIMIDDKEDHLVATHEGLHGYHINSLTIADFIDAVQQAGIESVGTYPR